jgi:type IV pilus assembly protein PilB
MQIMQELDRIVSFLKEQKIVPDDVLEGVLKKQKETGRNVISILRDEALIGDEDLQKVVLFSNKIEFVTLSSDMVDPIAAQLVTYEFVSQHDLIPVRKEGSKLYVAMASPLNLAVRDQIEAKTGCQVVPLSATPAAIRQAIMYHFNVGNVTRQDIVSLRLKQAGGEKSKNKAAKIWASDVKDAPITRLVSSIINGAIDARASDIHIEPQVHDMRVRYRVDGILHDAIEIPSTAQQEVVSHIKILADMDISEHRVPQDGHVTVDFHGKEYDLRVSSLPSVAGEKIAIRVLDKSTGMWTLDDVIDSPDENAKFRSLISNPYGMILLTGPTGSGKTTTLYSALQVLNTPEMNVVTIEDPVEYRLGGITQIQVNRTAGMTFASGLRSIVRQDPDIILVGEIRDLETAEIAVSASLTGHLVLSTLHTNDAVGAVSRLVNLGIQPFLMASALLGVVGQRLVRTFCEKCKQPYEPTEEEKGYLQGEAENVTFYQSGGCNSCYHTGYHGRKAIYEILVVSHQIRTMITEGRSDDELKTQALKEGMSTMRVSGIKRLLAGQTSFDEMRRVIDMRQK